MNSKGLDALVCEIRQLYTAGHTQEEIAQATGASPTSVGRLMRRNGIAVRPDYHARGPRHAKWKGDSASLSSLHGRVKTRLGVPKRCDVCGLDDPSRFYDWANLTGNYADPDDYARMCRSCHRSYDNARWRGPGVLSVDDAAKRIGVSKGSLCRIIRSGLIKAEKAGSGRFSPYRITEEAVADYLQRRAS